MRRSVRPLMEELDDLEDKSWKRKSYALAQHNALPIPMPHPVYPQPMACPPPAVVIRSSRVRSRAPGAGYRHPVNYPPVLGHNYYQKPPQPNRLPTLCEMNTGTPDLPLRKAPPPPQELPIIQSSPLEHADISFSHPELTTFRASPSKSVISPASPSHPNNIRILSPRPPDIKDSFRRPTNIPMPLTKPNHTPASSTWPTHILPPQSHIDSIAAPSKPFILQDSTAPRHGTVHSTFTTFGSPPLPESTSSIPPTTTFLPQQTHNSPPSPLPVPKTSPSLSSKSPPRQVQPKGSKIDQTVPSPPPPAQKIPHKKNVPMSPRPKEAPPAIPSSTSKDLEFLPESQKSLPSSSESFIAQPKPSPIQAGSLDKPIIPSKPASHSPLVDVNLTSTLVSPSSELDAKQDTSKIRTSLDTPLEVDSENPRTTGNASDVNSFLVECKSPFTSQIFRDSKSPMIQSNSTISSPIKVSSLNECSSFTPEISKNSESDTTESSTTTSFLPDDKTEPQSVTPAPQHLPLTPSSQSHSLSLVSIGCPRTPTSIRAAPSWQPMFPATPLTRRSTSVSNSENSLSPRSSNTTPHPTMAPEGCQHFLPTPPSSPFQTHVDSVTPSSSISSFPHGQGQSFTGEEEMQHQAASAEDSPEPSCSLPPDTTLHNSDKAIMPVVNNTSQIDELGVTPSKPLPAAETFQTYKTRFWILTVFSFICFLQTIVWGTFGPIAESAQAAFSSWDDSTIAAFPNWGPIIVVVFIIPMVWLSQKLGLQVAMIVCELFLTLGTMLRCFTSQEAIFTVMCHVSSVLFAFAACFTLSLPAMVAATWFPPSERITATAVGTLMCQLGAAAMYLGALVVRYPSRKDVANLTVEEREDIRGDIMVLMYIHFGAAVLLLLAVTIYFPARPPTPPSASSTEERIDYFKAIRMIFKKLQMVLVMLVFAFSFGVPVVWIAVLNLSLKDIGINQDKAMGVAVTAVVCSSITAFIAARITDKMYGHLKMTVIVLLSISSVFFLWFLLLTTQVIYPSLGQVYVAVTGGLGFQYATVPLLVELAVEIGFPIPESVTGATLTFVFNLVSLVFLGLFQIPNDSHLWVSCVLLACVSLSIIPLCFVKETHKRSDTDRKFM